MNEIIEMNPVTKQLQDLLEKKLTPSQTRDLAITLGYFEKNSCQEVRGYVLPKRINDYFMSGAIQKLFLVGETHMKEVQIREFCENKFAIHREIIQFVKEEFFHPELLVGEPVAVIFANIHGFRYDWMSKELLQHGTPFAEARTLDGNRKRKVTPRTLYRALYEIYFQRS